MAHSSAPEKAAGHGPCTGPDTEQSVYARYARAAREVEPSLCCPVEYRRDYLAAIPSEIIERDYGCGDPTPYVRRGETVLDLGCGGGKICYIAAQIVGPDGRVVGIDANQEMLALARRHRHAVAEHLGYANVDFRCGLIQDLALDLDLLAEELARSPVRDQTSWLELRALEARLRRERPLVRDASVDCVVSSCVLNLVQRRERSRLFAELFRVLRPGGRAAISDIVSDEDVPEQLEHDPELWSGCIAGAFREDLFLRAFADAGFCAMSLARRQTEPWRTVAGIEFRAVTVVAYKPDAAPPLDRNQALLYRGPFRSVEDDEGHVFRRGDPTAVSDRTFRLLGGEPYAGLFEAIEPRCTVPAETAPPFDPQRPVRRDPRETKRGGDPALAVVPSCCGSRDACC